MPSVLVIDLFSFLPVDDRCRVTSVCKSWNAAEKNALLWKTLDLSKHFSTLRLYGEDEWKKIFKNVRLDFKGLSVLTKKVCVALYRALQHPEIKKEGGSLITIPGGLTLNAFLELAKIPARGDPIIVDFYCKSVKRTSGDVVIEKTRRVFISRASFKSFSFSTKTLRYKQAELRTVIAHILLTYHSTPTSSTPVTLYEGNYIQCVDRVCAAYHPLVGCWCSEGFISIQDTCCVKPAGLCFVVQMEC